MPNQRANIGRDKSECKRGGDEKVRVYISYYLWLFCTLNNNTTDRGGRRNIILTAFDFAAHINVWAIRKSTRIVMPYTLDMSLGSLQLLFITVT